MKKSSTKLPEIERTRIFTKNQLELIQKRLNGDLEDDNGQFANIRMKLIEIYEWNKPEERAKLKKLLTKRGKVYKPIERAKKMKEQSLEDFTKENRW